MIEIEDIDKILNNWKDWIVEARAFPVPRDVAVWGEPEFCIVDLADALVEARDRIVTLEDMAYESMEGVG